MQPRLFQKDIISSVGYDQNEIIKDIVSLYCPNGIQCDPTFSKGNFYKNGVREPQFKFDIKPYSNRINQSDYCDLPLSNNSIESIMFDPPFVGGSQAKGNAGIIKQRFGYEANIPNLWMVYKKALKEFYRILQINGILIFKCQDSVESGKQYLSCYKIINMALNIGYYPIDLFILIANHRVISPNQYNQCHARKFHSYFLVFKKEKSPVNYYDEEGIK